jgi:hypothetical protein
VWKRSDPSRPGLPPARAQSRGIDPAPPLLTHEDPPSGDAEPNVGKGVRGLVP